MLIVRDECVDSGKINDVADNLVFDVQLHVEFLGQPQREVERLAQVEELKVVIGQVTENS